MEARRPWTNTHVVVILTAIIFVSIILCAMSYSILTDDLSLLDQEIDSSSLHYKLMEDLRIVESCIGCLMSMYSSLLVISWGIIIVIKNT